MIGVCFFSSFFRLPAKDKDCSVDLPKEFGYDKISAQNRQQKDRSVNTGKAMKNESEEAVVK